MNDEAGDFLPELQLYNLLSPVVLEVIQLLLFVLALIVLVSLVITLGDLILLCREEYKKFPPRPTRKSQTQTGRDTRIVRPHFTRFGKWK